jgi:hypothetical protein
MPGECNAKTNCSRRKEEKKAQQQEEDQESVTKTADGTS